MATPVTQIEYPPLDSQATYTFIDSQLTAAQKTGCLPDDFRLALATALGVSPSGYSMDDLWRRYLTDIVSADGNAKSGNPAAGGRKGGQHMGHYYSQSHRSNPGNANKFPQGGGSFPTTNLVTHLDAGDAASYPGTGATLTDLSGNANHATWLPGATECAAIHTSGDAGYFNFTSAALANDRVFSITDVADLQPDGTQEHTIAILWAPDETNSLTTDYLVSKSNVYSMLYNYYSNGRHAMFINAGGSYNNTFSDYDANENGGWYAVILRRDAGGFDGFVNGNANTARLAPSINSTVAKPFYIGGTNTSTGSLVLGKFAAFAYWNTALTDQQIADVTSIWDGRYTLSTSYKP